MAVRLTGSPVTPEEAAALLQVSPERERAIANLTGYKTRETKSHAFKKSSRKRTYKFSAKRTAKQR
jgi:hypothetical protein